MISALQYLITMHLDITYAVHVVFQFMCARHTTHLRSIKYIFRCLQRTQNHGLFLCTSTSSFTIAAYLDEDWVGCKHSCHSTDGYDVYNGPKRSPRDRRSSLWILSFLP